jgi:protein-tyrosine phosphatase
MIQDRRASIISNVTVARTDKNAVEICWSCGFDDLGVSIYAGDSPSTIDGTSPAARVIGGSRAEISGLASDVRHYFSVVPEGGSGVITAERRVPFEGAANFRDLGGYETSDGRRLKWGQIFRSDSLARLTHRDQSLLKRIGIRLAFDLRTPFEVRLAPDRLPEDDSVEYLHLPIIREEFDPFAALNRIRKGDVSWLTEKLMINGYIRNIEDFPGIWGMVINRLAEPDSLPLVFHCTGGKDRTGICAALIMLALGVPEETIIYDHELSNAFIADWVRKVEVYIKALGIDPEMVAPYFTASREGIVSVLDHIRNTYGCAANYLNTKAGVSKETLSLMKQELLE